MYSTARNGVPGNKPSTAEGTTKKQEKKVTDLIDLTGIFPLVIRAFPIRIRYYPVSCPVVIIKI